MENTKKRVNIQLDPKQYNQLKKIADKLPDTTPTGLATRYVYQRLKEEDKRNK